MWLSLNHRYTNEGKINGKVNLQLPEKTERVVRVTFQGDEVSCSAALNTINSLP